MNKCAPYERSAPPFDGDMLNNVQHLRSLLGNDQFAYINTFYEDPSHSLLNLISCCHTFLTCAFFKSNFRKFE